MAETSLRNYLKKVERLVQEEAWEEALANARQILEFYPRNAAAYRLLGQALVGQSRMDEAGEIFRRLLSAFPTDFTAHQHLSLVYEKLKQPDLALWHLERAFDAAPNDKNVVGRLRDLYAEYRGIKVERLQLTAGAVAGQYISSGLFDQAVEVLQKALERAPDRADLKLLLARALWSSGQPVDAAEVAIEVLNVLPYAVAANRILTEVWLQEQRPSDAQRYLSRIEDVDPYLAFRLATGENVPPETFMLEELDYDQYVQQTLTSQNPDWLTRLEGEAPPDDYAEDDSEDWLKDIEPAKPAPEAPKKVTGSLKNMLPDNPATSQTGSLAVDDDSMNHLPPDVLEKIERMRGIAADATVAAPTPEAVQAALEDNDPDDDWMKVLQEDPAESAGERQRTGITGLLASLKDEEEAVDDDSDDMDWLSDLEELDAKAVGDTSPLSADAAAASGLFDTGTMKALENRRRAASAPPVQPADVDDTDSDLPDFADDALFDEDDEAQPDKPNPYTAMTGLFEDVVNDESSAPDTDGLSWLDTGDLVDEAAAERRTTVLPGSTLPSSDAGDKMAWMKEHDIEVDENAEKQPLFGTDPFDTEDDVPLRAGSSDAWMADTGIEFEDDSGITEDAVDAADPLAWMKDSGAELSRPSSKPKRPETPIPATTPVPESPGDYQVTDDSLLDEMLELESLADASALETDGMADSSGEMPEAVPEEPVDWQETMPEEPQSWQQDNDDDDLLDDLEWLSEDSGAAETAAQSELPVEPEASEEDSMAWLADSEMAGKTEASFEFESGAAGATEEELAEDSMAWLSEDIAAETTAEQPASDEDMAEIFGDMPEAAAEDDLFTARSGVTDWLAQPPAENAEEGAYTWNDEIADDTGANLPVEDDEPAEAGFAWGDELADEGDALPVEASTGEEFAWGEELPEDAEELPLEAAGEFDWSAELEAGEAGEEDDLAEGTNWLADIGDAEEVRPTTAAVDFWGEEVVEPQTEGFAWSDAIPDPDSEAAADEAFVPDAELSDEDAFAEPAGAEWLSDIGDAEEIESADAEWLSDAGIEEVEAATPDEAGDLLGEESLAPGFEWSDELDEDIAADEEALSEESPGADWLADLTLPEEDDAAEPLMPEFATSDESGEAGDESFAWGEALPGEDNLLPEEEMYLEEDLLLDDLPLEDDDQGEAWLPEMANNDFAASDEQFELVDVDEEDLSLEDIPASEQDLDWMMDTGEMDDFEEAYEETPSPTAGMTGLLNSIESSRYDSDLPEEAAPQNVDWLSEVDEQALTDEEEDFPTFELENPPSPPVIGENFEWGSDILDESGEDEPEWLADEGEAGGTDDSFEWEQEFADETAQPAEAEWLSDIGTDTTTLINEADADSAFEWSDDDSAEPAPDWLNTLDQGDEPIDDEMDEFGEPLPDEAEYDAEATPLAENEFTPEANGDFDEQEMTAASNAPDWLNAMVPGLDIDYEAREELPAQPETPAQREIMRRKSDFGWLQQVVDEEETAAPAPTGKMDAVRKFVFSRLPAWVRPKDTPAASQGSDVTAAAAAGTVALPDYLMDDDPLMDEPDFMDSLDSEFNADMPEDEFDDFGADFDDFDFDEPDNNSK